MHDNYAFRDKFCFTCVRGEESECDINKPPFYHLKGYIRCDNYAIFATLC